MKSLWILCAIYCFLNNIAAQQCRNLSCYELHSLISTTPCRVMYVHKLHRVHHNPSPARCSAALNRKLRNSNTHTWYTHAHANAHAHDRIEQRWRQVASFRNIVNSYGDNTLYSHAVATLQAAAVRHMLHYILRQPFACVVRVPMYYVIIRMASPPKLVILVLLHQ